MGGGPVGAASAVVAAAVLAVAAATTPAPAAPRTAAPVTTLAATAPSTAPAPTPTPAPTAPPARPPEPAAAAAGRRMPSPPDAAERLTAPAPPPEPVTVAPPPATSSATSRPPAPPPAGLAAGPAGRGPPERVEASGETGYGWPLLPPPVVLAPFGAPEDPFGPGHRGVDLAGTVGQPVRAAREGSVVFAGPVAGHGVVSVQHDDGLRTTYEPLLPSVRAGDVVAGGAVLGTLVAGHRGCSSPCLHWGVRRDRLEYLDPLVLLRPPHVRLLPVPEPWPDP